MRIFVRILGFALLFFLVIGLLNWNGGRPGPGGTLGAIDAGARVLDALLLFVAGVGLIAISFYKRPRPSDTAIPTPQYRTTNTEANSRQAPTRPVTPDVGTRASSALDTNDGARPTEVSVRGYREMFAVNPRVKVLWNEVPVGEVGRDESLQVNRQGKGVLKFKSSFRSAAIDVPAGAKVVVQLAWDRFSGKLIVHVVP
ncbi:hypothetical protein [Microcella sp.]|uniref:hypothetical protein n=1 Tax=Microcella sp. TaxID=1913979 RepID=UPI003F71F7BD